ncbi:F-box associated domain containing protein [Tanacetum coccineum]
MTKGYPGGFPFLFYCNLPGKNYRRGQTNPGTPQVYTLGVADPINKEKARGRSRCVPRRAILIPLIRLAWHPFSPLYPLKLIFIMGQNISKLSNTHNRNQPFLLRTQPRQHVASTSNSTMSSICSNMEDLPLNAMVDILSRLPVKTIIHCKCVCKKWHFLVSESYFVKLHLSRSPVGLIIHHFTMQEMHNNGLGTLKLVEIEDEVDHPRLYHDPIMNFDLNHGLLSRSVKMFEKLPVGSINGLVCLTENGNESNITYICNPVTREYMMLPKHIFFSERNESVILVLELD